MSIKRFYYGLVLALTVLVSESRGAAAFKELICRAGSTISSASANHAGGWKADLSWAFIAYGMGVARAHKNGLEMALKRTSSAPSWKTYLLPETFTIVKNSEFYYTLLMTMGLKYAFSVILNRGDLFSLHPVRLISIVGGTYAGMMHERSRRLRYEYSVRKELSTLNYHEQSTGGQGGGSSRQQIIPSSGSAGTSTGRARQQGSQEKVEYLSSSETQ